MKKLICITLLIAACSLTGQAQQPAHNHMNPPSSAGGQMYGKVEQELIRLDKEFAAASARGDAKALGRILADNYTFTDFDGRVSKKADALANLKGNEANKIEASETSDYQVQVYGNTAVMNHLTTVSSGGAKVQLQTMHVWVKRGSSWQVATNQWTAVTPRNSMLPDLTIGCEDLSYQPEIRSLFGDSATIIAKLDDDQMGLTKRRAYLLMVEKKGSAEFSFFERVDRDNFRVSQWEGETLGDMREKLTEVLLANRGIACVGEQTKLIVKASFHPDDRGTIPMPLSARAAFSHILKKHGNDYLRVTVLLLC